MKKTKITKQQLENLILSKPIKDVLKDLNILSTATLYKILKQNNIKFKGRKGYSGLKSKVEIIK